MLTPNPASHGPASSGAPASPLASTTADHDNLSSRPGAIGGQAITGGGYTGGVGPATAPRDSKPALGLALVAALGLVVVGGGGVYAYSHAKKPAANGAPLVATAGSSPVVTALPEPPASVSASAPPAVKVVSVKILAPTETLAELDGAPTTVRGDAVEIRGAPGSRHKLRLSLGETSKETLVTILESGDALPATFELVAKAAGKPAAGAKDVRVAAAGTGAAAASAASVAPRPKPAATSPSPAASAEPSVKREF